ncbi:unnamed protein product, partial [Iphiclides podalirius]
MNKRFPDRTTAGPSLWRDISTDFRRSTLEVDVRRARAANTPACGRNPGRYYARYNTGAWRRLWRLTDRVRLTHSMSSHTARI